MIHPLRHLSAEFASAAPVTLVLRSTKTVVKVPVPAGADAATWHTVDLHTLNLPAGEHTLQLQGEKEGWKGGPGVRRVLLTPVK